ncbi:MAG: TrkH family potassium uptake protein [Lachnospiraceae bacterium]|nr:TrkH family potassium uptake protein [Lachnospiraceae bacterium]
MNSSIIRYILGQILKVEAILMLLPCVVALIYQESEGFMYLWVVIVALVCGILMTIKKPKNNVFYLKEGCVTTALSWILISIVGAFPFWLTKEIPSYTDALFETISGFTTTGASILSDVEALSKASTFWRCFTHWIGGMGVLVFMLAIVPLSGGSNMNLMRAESPGPSVGKLVPKLKHTARLLYVIYFSITVLQVVFLVIGKMPVFDAMATSFATAGTGGFGIKNDSMVSYSPYIQWVVTIFMILCGINFNAYYYILLRDFKKAFSMEEVKGYLLIIVAATAIIFINIVDTAAGILDALRHSAFQVASIITTTGFATVDFDLWTGTARVVIVLLMFIGACAGSTGGGIKVSRIMVLFKTIFKEFHSYIHPKSIKKVKFEGKTVEHEVIRSINVYFITMMILFTASVFLVAIEGRDMETTFTAVATTINNIGPGLEGVGPTQNFASFTCFSKYVFMFDMLAGRLELFPLLILFHPVIWKDMFVQRRAEKRLRKKNI